MISNRIFKVVLTTLLVMGSFTLFAGAQADKAAENKDQQPQQLWEDFMHYAVIGNWEVANATGQALIESKPDPVVLLNLAESSRYANAYRDLILLQKDTPLKAVAEDILKLVEEGRRMLSMDIERIEQDVIRLSSTTRARLIAVERLKDSGEYAAAVMVSALMEPQRASEQDVIRWALPQIGRPAVKPLLVALQRSGQLNLQMIILEALGQIGYPEALPYIKAIIEDAKATPELKNIAIKSFTAISKNMLPSDITAAGLFEKLALDYYDRQPSLLSPANQDEANIWFWQEQTGLYREVVPQGAFEELMAMRASEDAIGLDKSRPESIALWLSAFFRLEAEGFQQPVWFDAGHENKIKQYRCENTGMLPQVGPGHADAATYALTAGPEYLHRVLARALKDRNRPVALAAINVLNRNAGQEALLFQLEGTRPLVEAMTFPDRQVRFAAALAIGRLLPGKDFEGKNLAVQILAEALRQRGQRFALVAALDTELRNQLAAKLLQATLYDSVTSDEFFSKGLEQMTNQPGLDLLVLSADIQHPGLEEALSSISKDYRLAYCPVLILAKGETLPLLKKKTESMPFVEVLAENSAETDVKEAVDRIMKRNNANPFTVEMADFYAGSAAAILRDLALTHNKVIPVLEAEAVMIDALRDARKPIQAAAIESLAHLESMKSQRALADMALDGALELPVRLMSFANLSISARQYGNLLAAEQIDKIYNDIVNAKEVDIELRNLAAQAYGSLNLPSATVSKLIAEQAR